LQNLSGVVLMLRWLKRRRLNQQRKLLFQNFKAIGSVGVVILIHHFNNLGQDYPTTRVAELSSRLRAGTLDLSALNLAPEHLSVLLRLAWMVEKMKSADTDKIRRELVSRKVAHDLLSINRELRTLFKAHDPALSVHKFFGSKVRYDFDSEMRPLLGWQEHFQSLDEDCR